MKLEIIVFGCRSEDSSFPYRYKKIDKDKYKDKYDDKDKDILRTPPKNNPGDL